MTIYFPKRPYLQNGFLIGFKTFKNIVVICDIFPFSSEEIMPNQHDVFSVQQFVNISNKIFQKNQIEVLGIYKQNIKPTKKSFNKLKNIRKSFKNDLFIYIEKSHNNFPKIYALDIHNLNENPNTNLNNKHTFVIFPKIEMRNLSQTTQNKPKMFVETASVVSDLLNDFLAIQKRRKSSFSKKYQNENSLRKLFEKFAIERIYFLIIMSIWSIISKIRPRRGFFESKTIKSFGRKNRNISNLKISDIENDELCLRKYEEKLKNKEIIAKVIFEQFLFIIFCLFYYKQPLNFKKFFLKVNKLIFLAIIKSIQKIMALSLFLKHNRNLSQFIADAFYLLFGELLKIYSFFIDYFFKIIFLLFVIFSYFGLSIGISFLYDVYTFLSFPIVILLWKYDKLFWYFFHCISVLWRLVSGRKCNILTKRIDCCDYAIDQLILGIAFFTVQVFLFQSVLIYYAFFQIIKFAIKTVKNLLIKIAEIIENVKIYEFFGKHFERKIFQPKKYWFKMLRDKNDQIGFELIPEN